MSEDNYTIKEMLEELRSDNKEQFQGVYSRLDSIDNRQREANHRTTKMEEWSVGAKKIIEANTIASQKNTFTRAKVAGGLAVIVFLCGTMGLLIRQSVKSSIEEWVSAATKKSSEELSMSLDSKINKAVETALLNNVSSIEYEK